MTNTIEISLTELARDSWSEQEKANVELVVDFVQNLMNNHDFAYVRENFMNSSYTQHNRNIPDGMENIVLFVEQFAKRFPDYTYDVKRIIADGEYVTFHSHATIKTTHRGNDTKGLNIVDIWKIKDGEIVEHWDSLQPLDLFMRFYILLTGGNIKNSNGVF